MFYFYIKKQMKNAMADEEQRFFINSLWNIANIAIRTIAKYGTDQKLKPFVFFDGSMFDAPL